MKVFFQRNISLTLLFLILLGAFFLRLYRFDNPIADWHSWRQADTSAVSRNFVEHGFDFLHPRFDDLSNVPSGQDNPQGYRFVEFPIYNFLQAFPAKYIGLLTLEEWGRLITILSSLGSITFLFLIVRKYVTASAATLVAFFYAFLPYNIYYGRTILPDPSMVTAFLGAIYFFATWASFEKDKKVSFLKKWGYFKLSLIFAITALLLKPYAAFFLLPIAVISFQTFGRNVFLQWKLYIFALVSLAPLVAWRFWIHQFPEGVPANTWLLNGNGIRFRPAFFRWIIYERVIKLISGFVGILFILPGVVQILQNRMWILGSFLVSSILYVCVFATGNVQHDYYQILIMPSIALCLGIGASMFYTYSLKTKINNLFILIFLSSIFTVILVTSIQYYLANIPLQIFAVILFSTIFSLLCFVLLLMSKQATIKQALSGITIVIVVFGIFYSSSYYIKDYFNINNRSIVIAGNAVDKVTPKDAKIIAPYDGDTSFLYQTKRQGWASFTYDLPKMIEIGADFLVLVNPTKNDFSFAKEYKITAQAKEYLIYDLHNKP